MAGTWASRAAPPALGNVEHQVPAVADRQAVDKLHRVADAVGLMADFRKAESMASIVATLSNSAVSSANSPQPDSQHASRRSGRLAWEWGAGVGKVKRCRVRSSLSSSHTLRLLG